MAVAVNIELPKIIVRRKIADATPVPLGTLMKLVDDNTVEVSGADGDAFGGIAIEEKTANDGIVDIGCALDGVWDMDTTAFALPSGSMVSIGGNQTIAKSVGTADLVDGSQFGRAETTRSGTNRIRVRAQGY